MDRRQFVVVSGLVTTGALIFGWNAFRRSPATEKEMPVLEQIVAQAAKSSEIPENALREALNLVQNRAYPAASIENGQVARVEYPFTEEYFRKLNATIVCRADSEFMSVFYSQMHPAQANSVRENIKYVIFTQKVYRDLGFMKYQTHGTSLGNGAVLIDSTVNFDWLPGNIRHEASHESDKATVSTLESETNALEAQTRVLHHQRSQIKGDSYDAQNRRDDLLGVIDGIREIQHTASYLKSFGAAFQNVYPTNVILSKDLLAANIEGAILRQIADSTSGKEGLEQEMYHAANAAYIALALPKGEAIARLYTTITNPLASDFDKINAIFALAYLAPNVMRINQGSPHFEKPHARGIDISIGDGARELIPDPQYETELKDFLKREAEKEASYKRGAKRPDFEHVGSITFPSHYNRFLIHGDLPPLEAFIANRPYKKYINKPLPL